MNLSPQDIEARAQLRQWIQLERERYADVVKFSEDADIRQALIVEMSNTGQFADRWVDFGLNYVRRAQLLGANTPQGRQAMGKAIVTFMHMLETALATFGNMPEPGHPSGEIR